MSNQMSLAAATLFGPNSVLPAKIECTVYTIENELQKTGHVSKVEVVHQEGAANLQLRRLSRDKAKFSGGM